MGGVSEKPCSRCGQVLPANAFNKAKWLASGLRPECKACYSAAKKAAWAAKPKSEMAVRKAENASLALIGKRRCKACGEVKQATHETFATVGTGSFNSTCRACDAVKTRIWAAKNEDRAKANAAIGWANRHARKIRATIRLSPEHRQQIRQIYAECKKLNKDNPRAWHVDHIMPLRGRNSCGLHVPWNLRIVPASVNVRKSNKCPTTESF